MNGAKDNLSNLRMGTEESHDGPSTLRVQTGGWFIQEPEEPRLRIDTNPSIKSCLLDGGRTLAVNSTAMVKRFLYLTPRGPTVGSE